MIKNIGKIISLLKKEYPKYVEPIVTEFSNLRKDPYLVLISCLISLRTKDEVTRDASYKLFELADTPEKMIKLSLKQIEKAIYPAGFYITKARRIRQISQELAQKYNSKVPDEIDELLKFKGVGRKTANLVVTLGYGKLGLCIDTHCHRIPNRLGLINTKNPHETEFTLRKILPKKYWIRFNDYFVAFGQNICRPIRPHCWECPLTDYCKYYKEVYLKSKK